LEEFGDTASEEDGAGSGCDGDEEFVTIRAVVDSGAGDTTRRISEELMRLVATEGEETIALNSRGFGRRKGKVGQQR